MNVEDDVDRIVMETFFRGKKDGVFVEVGAARPDYLSISARFRRAGWRVISIEPNPDFCALHEAKGYPVLQYACGAEDKDGVDFTVVDSNGVEYLGGKVTAESFSSLGIQDEFKEMFKQIEGRSSIKTISVKLRRLDTILAEHAPDVGGVDAVCIDVEGWELTVLSGFSLNRFRPAVVVLENIFRKPEYSAYMTERGYALWLGLGLNEVYIRADMQSPLLRASALKASAGFRIAALKKRAATLFATRSVPH